MGPTGPQIGDLIVRPRRRSHDFIISILGASASRQTHCATRDDAVTLATRTATLLRSAVWETEDGISFDRVVR
jgi:hypothetical protein